MTSEALVVVLTLAGAVPSREGVARSEDGLEVSYVTAGRGEPALVFIHGGLADRSVWREQLSLATERRVVMLDLGGHGRSGRSRESWTLRSLGEDVRAVVLALGLKRVVLIGSSMGGPVALEAARLLPERVIGVAGVDTLHSVDRRPDPEAWRRYVDGFRQDFPSACATLAASLFHDDAKPELRESVRRLACSASPQVTTALLDTFTDYDMAAALRAAKVPVRCINGDLYPTDIEGNRRVIPDFDAVVLTRTGHFPMLERPPEFNRALQAWIRHLSRASREGRR